MEKQTALEWNEGNKNNDRIHTLLYLLYKDDKFWSPNNNNNIFFIIIV